MNIIKKYEGVDGLYKVTMNSTKANGELLIYEISYSSLNKFLDEDRRERARRAFLKNKVKVREITNQTYKESYTSVEGYDEQVMNVRYVDEGILKIDAEMIIYNDVVVYYSLQNPINAIEIHDERLAKMQRQIFEFVWKSGKKLSDKRS